MTAPKTSTLIDQCNELRAELGQPPHDMRPDQEIMEEKACDEFAEDWVRGFGGIDEFRVRFEQLVSIMRGDAEEIYCASLASLTDQWEYLGLTAADFIRLRREIEGWICSHSARYSRFTILN